MRYYFELLIMPVYFIVVFVRNSYTLMKQSIDWSVKETKQAYISHRRYYGKD